MFTTRKMELNGNAGIFQLPYLELALSVCPLGESMMFLKSLAYVIVAAALFIGAAGVIDNGAPTPLLIGYVFAGLAVAAVMLALAKIIELITEIRDSIAPPPLENSVEISEATDPYAFVEKAAEKYKPR